MMNKLGFEIVRTKNGLTPTLICNEGSWNYNIIDVGGYLKLFCDIDGTDRFITFLSFDANGCFLTLLRCISGRVGDNLSGWIYIPNTIEIAGKEINTVYNFVHDVLLMPDITDYKEKIDSFFSKPYPAKSTPISYTPSSKEDKYGFIRGNVSPSFCSLEDFFKYRYQPEYSQYRAVFFLNSKDSIVEEYYKLFTDLTNHKLKELCVLLDFSAEDKRLLRADRILDENEKDVCFPCVRAKGELLHYKAVRKGFEPINLNINVDADYKRLALAGNKVSWQKRITKDMFVIVNGKDEKITNASISVKGKAINNRGELFGEKSLEDASISVTVDGYKKYERQHVNLLNKDTIRITMNREPKQHTYTIEIGKGKNAENAEMTLVAKGLSSPINGKSPLRGYSYNDRNVLHLSGSFLWLQRLYGFLFAVFLVVCYLGYSWYESGSSTFSDDIQQEDTTSTQVEDKPFTDQAIAYMDKNKTWDKDSLHNYMGNDTLYNSINEYNFEYLVGLDASDCKSLSDVVNCASKVYNERQNVKGKFSEDGKITISKWIDKVEKRLAESKSDNNSVEGKKADDAQNKSADKNANDRKEQAKSNGKFEEQVKSKQAKGKEQAKEQQKASKSNTKDAKGTKGAKPAKKPQSDNQPANETNKLGR